MNAGQLIMSMTQSVTKSVIPDVASTTNGEQKLTDGGFAGLLGALQTQAGHPPEASQVKKEVAASESEPADVSDKGLTVDVVQGNSEMKSAETRMVLAAYALTSGMSIVNTSISHDVDVVQNVQDALPKTALEQSVRPDVENSTLQSRATSAPVEPATKASKAVESPVQPQPIKPLQENGKMPTVNTLPNHDVDTVQNVSVTPKSQVAEIVTVATATVRPEQQPQPAMPAMVEPLAKAVDAGPKPQTATPIQQPAVNTLTAAVVQPEQQQPQSRATSAPVEPATKASKAVEVPVQPQPIMQNENGKTRAVNTIPNQDVDTVQNVSVTPKGQVAEIVTVATATVRPEQQPQPAMPAMVEPLAKAVDAGPKPQTATPIQQPAVNTLTAAVVQPEQQQPQPAMPAMVEPLAKAVDAGPKPQTVTPIQQPAVNTLTAAVVQPEQQQPQPAKLTPVEPATKASKAVEAPVQPQPIMQNENGKTRAFNTLPNQDVDTVQNVSVTPKSQVAESVQVSRYPVEAQALEEIAFLLPRPIAASKVNQLEMKSSSPSTTSVFSSQIISLDLEQLQKSPLESEAVSELPEETHSAQRQQIGKVVTFVPTANPDAGLKKLDQPGIVMTNAITKTSLLQDENNNEPKGVAEIHSTVVQQASVGVLHDTRNENARPSTVLSIKEENMVSEKKLVPGGGAVLTSDDSRNSGEQTGADLASDNRNLTPLVSAQLKPEHQNAGSVQSFKVNPEQPRQDLPEQIVHQIRERLVQHEVKPGNQQISLTLTPENLGEVKMNFNLQGQKLSVEIVTDNRAARDAILQHSDSLKDSLARQNITVESFDVTSNGRGTGNPGHNQDAWKELARQKQQQFWTSPVGYDLPQVDTSLVPSYQAKNEHAMLDIHY